MTRSSVDPTIPEAARPHRATDDTEEVYFEGSPLLRGEFGRVVGYSTLAAVVAGLAVVNRVRPAVHLPWWAYAIAAAVAAGLMLYPFVSRRSLSYRITNYRIDVARGLLSRTVDTMELWHVEDLRLHQSASGRLLGVGTITVLSHDETTPTLVLKGLPQPAVLFRELEQRVIAVKRQRGVMKVDQGT